MTKPSQYQLSEDDVKRWKSREDTPTFSLNDLEEWQKELLKGKKQKEKIREAIEGLIEDIGKLDTQIQASEDKERRLLKTSPKLTEIFSAIDSGRRPPGAIVILKNSRAKKRKKAGDRIVYTHPSKEFLASQKWVLTRASFTTVEQHTTTKISSLRNGCSLVKKSRLGAVQKLQYLRVEAITRDISLSEESINLILTPELRQEIQEIFVVQNKESYTSFTFHGEPNLVTTRQGAAIKILHQAHENNPSYPDVSGKVIVEQLGSGTSELRDTFRRTKADKLWGTLIVLGEKNGFYRLNI